MAKSTKGREVKLRIDLITADRALQAREKTDDGTVQSYADAMEAGAKFPAIVVFYDKATYWLADGFHRFDAATRLGHKTIQAVVFDGTRDDAILYAAGSNAAHGLPRSREDKRKAVRMLLTNQDWWNKSVRCLADTAKVAQPTAQTVRDEWEAERTRAGLYVPTERIGRDGRDFGPYVKSKATPPPSGVESAPVDDLPPKWAVNAPGEAEQSSPPKWAVAAEADQVSEPPTPAPEPVPATVAILDGLKLPVPAGQLAAAFRDAPEYQALISSINALKRQVEELKDRFSGAFLAPICQAAVSDLENAKQVLKCAKPYTVCPHCKGKGCAGARAICKATGFITEDLFKRLPADMKAWCQDRQDNQAA